MSKRRLSRLQKWIIENCFRVTIMQDRSSLKEIKDKKNPQNFYKEDILLSFFLLTPNNSRLHSNRSQHFYDSPNYAKAHVSVHRSIVNLIQKGYVYTSDVGGESSVQIYLTGDGIKRAAELLSVNDYYVPNQPEANDAGVCLTTYNRYKKAKNAEEWVNLLRHDAQGITCENDGVHYASENIHLVCGALNAGRGVDQLCTIISVRLKMDPFNGEVYAFCGQSREQIRYIRWDGSGFQMVVRRREYGRYTWPHQNLGLIITVDAKEFDFLLRGKRQRNSLNYQ